MSAPSPGGRLVGGRRGGPRSKRDAQGGLDAAEARLAGAWSDCRYSRAGSAEPTRFRSDPKGSRPPEPEAWSGSPFLQALLEAPMVEGMQVSLIPSDRQVVALKDLHRHQLKPGAYSRTGRRSRGSMGPVDPFMNVIAHGAGIRNSRDLMPVLPTSNLGDDLGGQVDKVVDREVLPGPVGGEKLAQHADIILSTVIMST